MYCYNEGMAQRNGEHLNIQCLLLNHESDVGYDSSFQKFHYHKYIELIYVLEGKVQACIGNEIHSVSSGSLVIIYADEPHTFRWSEQNKYIVVKMLPEILSTSEQTLNEFEYVFNFNASSPNKTRVIPPREDIGILMNNAYSSFVQNEYCSELFVRADIIKVCAHLLGFWRQNGEISSITYGLTPENLKTVNRIAAYTKEVNGSIRTHEAARLCNLSDGHFSRIFKSLMGKTFTEYAKSVKIAEAERLLKCTDFSVTDIAQHLCYATASHFIEDFKKEKGISPKKYKTM